ncbi:MAG: molybdopterin-dependent oxidoreductase [Vicinamibacterales bacterium]|nr:molybdopterin-dependent oxidoreductase [Vicinamibacterales bacterium]
MHRRQLVAILGALGLGYAGYRMFGGSGMAARGLRWPPGLPPALTPVGDFYTVSKNLFFDPDVDASSWSLRVAGLVERPLTLTLDDLRAMPAVTMPATLACIGHGVPARPIGNAEWTGVPLRDVLARAGGPQAGAEDLIFIGADNYTDSIPIAKALDAGTLLAYAMNGAPLVRAHGAPLRAIVPGIYGMKNAKWIRTLELVSGDYRGYWQQRGWSEAAPYMTLSRFDVPREGDGVAAGVPLTLGGIAFAGDRGISRVEVSVDGGTRWETATLAPPLGPFTWVLWTWDWTPEAPGSHRLIVRATDGAGALQPAEPRPSFPAGATGLHAVSVRSA